MKLFRKPKEIKHLPDCEVFNGGKCDCQAKEIREISCNDTNSVDYYRELARKNEVIIKEVPDRYVIKIYKEN